MCLGLEAQFLLLAPLQPKEILAFFETASWGEFSLPHLKVGSAWCSSVSSRGEAKDSALLSSRDVGLLEPPERPHRVAQGDLRPPVELCVYPARFSR